MIVAELLASQAFEFSFHHEFCEQAYRQFRDYAYVLDEPQFTSENGIGPTIAGRFLALVEFEDGPHGATTGTFRLALSRGLDSSDAEVVLQDMQLDVAIEAAPFGAGAEVARVSPKATGS